MQPVSGHNRISQIYVKEIIALLQEKRKQFFEPFTNFLLNGIAAPTMIALEFPRLVDKAPGGR